MPAEEYDDEYDDEYDEDEYEEVDDVDEVDEVDDVDEEAAATEKGRRQLRRGRLAQMSDELTGGAARPGEEDIKRSPFIMLMSGIVLGLVVLVIVFGVLILTRAEESSFQAAVDDLKASKFREAEASFDRFLESYPGSEHADAARIGRHTARVRTFVDKTSFTPDNVKDGVNTLKEMIDACRDLEGFGEERENVGRYAKRLARVGAIVAEKNRLEEPLELSRRAGTMLEKFSGPDGVPLSVADDIRRLQRKAEAAILKQGILTKALDRINGLIEAGNTLGALADRQELIDQYEVLAEDPDILAVLDRVLKIEVDATQYEDVGLDATTEERADTSRPAAALTLRTQASVDQVSVGQLVFAVGIDRCIALDSEEGTPVWKRTIGTNPPFAPILVDAAEPAMLVYHSDAGELMLLTQKTGALIWRLSITDRPAGRPLILDGQIYLTTASGALWKVSLSDGRAIARLRFSQPVVGPPAVTRDRKFMVIPGDQDLVYTMSISPLKCVAVSYIDHRIGSVEAPMMSLGELLLLCDNVGADRSRLRVMTLNASNGALSVRQEELMDGQIRDASLVLRGTQLFVPSTPQRVTAFTINDSPDANPPVSRIGANQLEDGNTAPIHLLAGPSDQLWMASEALRKFRVRTNALELLPQSVASGVHMQPIQFQNQKTYLTTVEAYSSSVFFTKADPQSMQGEWRTVIGTNVVAAGPSSSKTSFLAVADFGEVFRVPLETVREGGFVLESISRFRIPTELKDRVGGLALKDGRLAAYCGGDEPALWTITPSGQLERRWPDLPGPPVLPPVAIDAGVVVATPGRLHLTAQRRRTEDYRAPRDRDDNITWKSLVALDGNRVLAIDSKNNFVTIEYRSSPKSHLFEVSSIQTQHRIDLRPTYADGMLLAGTAEGKLLALSADTLEPLAEVDLQGIASNSPYVAGDRIFVEVAREKLRVLKRDRSLEETAVIDLDNQFLVGPPLPLPDGGFLACLADGTILALNADGQLAGNKLSLGQAARMGPISAGDDIIVVAVDGSLYSVRELLN